MARTRSRIPEEYIRRLKETVSIEDLCRLRGIDLKPHGTKDRIGRCPFHEDETPSFVVSPEKNLFHCMGCGAAGSVIDLVMKLDQVDFREAVERLTDSDLPLKTAKEKNSRPAVAPERAAQLLDRVMSLYEKAFSEKPEGVDYLKTRGIESREDLDAHRAGYADDALRKVLPESGEVIDELKALGVFSESGREHFCGCVVFPVFDAEGGLVTLYGRHTQKHRHVFLPVRRKGLWNLPVIKTYPELIVVESVLDALSVEAAGSANVVALNGCELQKADLEELRAYGVQKLVLLLDGDEAGRKAAERLNEKLSSSFSCSKLTLPDGHDPNSYLQAYGASALREFLQVAAESASEPSTVRAGGGEERTPAIRSEGTAKPPASSGTSVPGGAAFRVECGLRRYEIRGLEKGARRLKATVRAEHAGRLHVDTLDLYSSRSRKILAGDLCRLFNETPEAIESDLVRMIKQCESASTQREDTLPPDAPAPMSPAERAEAEAFGKTPKLLDAVLSDFERAGLVGEESNKQLVYLAAVSRKMDEPLSVLILSSSGAGKTALQDGALAFVPPEELVKLTSLSGKALFYKERLALRHKVLALEEGSGAEEASYAIRNLISAGELVIESTIKDLGTGRLTTMENRVEGPTSVFITTTNPDTDPETRSRFFVTSVDESREQTRAILEYQRKRQTLEGVRGSLETEAILRKHRNFQRLLKPLAVVNPFAGKLTYGDDRLQGRRDHPKYLNLIKAVAFLHQMQREIKTARRIGGEPFEYIEVTPEDVATANRLAHEILGHSLDELSRPGRTLLLELERMVNEHLKPENSRPAFSRRQIREHTGWSNYRVHTHLRELIEYEYLSVETDRNTNGHRYRLLYDGQGKEGERFMLGLADPDG